MMNFKAFNKDIEISAVVKSVNDVKDLFRAYNIQIEEEEEGPEDEEYIEPDFIEPIIEMTYEESEEEVDPLDVSDHAKAKLQLEQLAIKPVKEEPLPDEWTSSLDGRNGVEPSESSRGSLTGSVADLSKDDGSEPGGVHRCDLCGAGFRIKHSITKHKRVVHGMHQFSCMFCQASYPLKRNLLEHILTHRGPHGFRCAICNKVRPNYISIQRHFKTHAEKNIPCNSCGAWFKTKWELRSHEIQHQEDRKFNCETCGVSFINPTKLREHMARHGGRRPYNCDICGKDFTAQGNLTNHRKLHFDEKPFKCQYCSLTFFSTSARKKHVPVHERERRKPFQCQDCNKKYTSTTSLAVHRLKFHAGGRVFHCHYCKCKFKSKSAISAHVAEHAVERPHSCQHCLCRYKNKRELRRHQREKEHYDTTLRAEQGDAGRSSASGEEGGDDWAMPEPQVCLSEGEEEPSE